MLKLTIKNLRANLSRLLATALAIATGTSFLAAGLMLTESMSESVRGDAETQYANVDVAVLADIGIEGDPWASLDEEVLATVESTPGADEVAGEFVAEATVLDETGASIRSRSQGRAWIEAQSLNPVSITEGRSPTQPGEIVVDIETAGDGALGVGDEVEIRTASGPLDTRIVGISEFGRSPSVDSGGTVFLEPDWAIEVLSGGHPGWQKILVSADDPASVEAALQASVGSEGEVLNQGELLEQESEQTQAFVDFLRPVLTGFAVLALFVAGFVIYNTFTVVVFQRSREIALVRAVGGTPGQVRRSLALEGLLLGAMASVAGLLLGLGISKLIEMLLDRFDIRLPGSGIAISGGIVATTVIAGMIITLVSVTIPSWRAGRTRPVEAMRSTAVDDSASSRVRMVFGGILLVGGLGLLLTNALYRTQWFYIAPGAILLFLGVVIGGPLLARLYARLARVAFGQVLPARIAADNMVRNPRRTSTTANALVIGLFLVTFVTVSGTALKDWVQAEIQEISEADYIVVASTALTDEIVTDVADTEGVETTSPVRTATLNTPDGSSVSISGADVDSLRTTVGLTATSGSLDRVAAGEGAANADFATFVSEEDSTGSQDPTVMGTGDSFSVVGPGDKLIEVPVAAQFEVGLDTLFIATIVSEELFSTLAGDRPVTQIYVRAEPSQVEQVGGRLDDLTHSFTGVEVIPGNFVGQAVGQAIDFMIAAVNGLLALSVLIALIGIINTMNLSIFERRRELGMVRALGMLRAQVRTMVRLEGILIGLLGTSVGVLSGTLVGWSAVVGLTNSSFSLAWGRIGVIFATGVAISLLACLLPARKALKVPMLEAMAGE